MARTLRTILGSGYTIVATGIVGFLLIIGLQNIAEVSRDDAFNKELNAINAERSLSLVSRDTWQLRFWDYSSQTFDYEETQKQRAAIKAQIDVHRADLLKAIAQLPNAKDYEPLGPQIEAYVNLSNQGDAQWKILGRWNNPQERTGINGAISVITDALATAEKNKAARLVPLLKDTLIEQYRLSRGGAGGSRAMPDGVYLAGLAERALKELPNAGFSADLRTEVENALRSLIRKDYIAQQLELSLTLRARNAAFADLEAGLGAATTRLAALQVEALDGFAQARAQSYAVVLYGSLALGALFVVFGVAATHAIRDQARRLQRSEGRFRDFASASSDTLVEIDGNYTIVEIFRINEKSDGYNGPRNSVGNAFFYDPTSDIARPLIEIFKKQLPFRDYVSRLPTPSGAVVWRRINGIPITDDNGNFAGYLLSIIDVTAQKNLEHEIAERQSLYEQLVEQVPGAVFVVRVPKNGGRSLEYVSPQYEILTGYTLEEATARINNGQSMMIAADEQRMVEMRRLAPGCPVEMKTRLTRKDGTSVPVIYSSRRVQSAPNGDLRSVGMLLDLSELEAAEAVVRERERQLASIMSNVGNAYFYSVTFGHGKIEPQFISDGVFDVLGYTPAEWTELFRIGEEGFALTVPEEDRPRIISMFRTMRTGGDAPYENYQTNNRRLRKDGSIVMCMTRGQNIKLPDGRILQEGMVIDISADVKRQEELVRLKAAVDSASDSIAIWERNDRTLGGDRKLIYANQVAQALLARTAPSSQNAEVWDSVKTAAEPDISLIEIDTAVEQSGQWKGVKLIQCNDGANIITDITVTRINDSTDLHVVRDVTALRELELSNERVRTELQDVVKAMDFAGEGISITNGKEILFANKSFAKIVGYDDPIEILGLTFHDLMDTSEQPLADIALATRESIALGKAYVAESSTFLRKDGSQKILRWSTAPLGDGRWINISRDVTDLRKVELMRAQLDRSVAEIASRRDLSKGAPRDVYTLILKEITKTINVSRAGIWRLVNDNTALQTVLLCQGGEIVRDAQVIHRADAEEFVSGLLSFSNIVADDAYTHPTTSCLSQSYLAKNNISSMLVVPILWHSNLWGVICIENSGAPRHWDSAEATYATYMADLVVMTLERIARDETQVRIEHLYQENASILSALDSTQERIIIEDAAGYVRYVNQAVADAWGKGSKSDLMGRSFDTAFPQLRAYRRGLDEEARAVISTEGSWSGQLLLSRPTGDQAYVDIRVLELPDKGLLYTAEDVTEERKHAQREQQLKTQLIEAQKMESIGRLAGGVAHDFNNIIAAVRAFASLVTSEVQSGTKAKTYADRIINTCDRAADLVRQILLFSRASRAELKPMDMSEVIDEVSTYLRASIPASVILDISPLAPGFIINGNPGQIVQVLMNLGLNARDAIGEKSGRIQMFAEEVVLTDQQVADYKPGLSMSKTNRTDGVIVHQFVVGAPLPDQRYLCLTVRDNGPGMPGITIERMFEPFFTTKEKSRGTGLGLPVVAAVVAAHTGFILVTTQQERGCRFNVFLPLTHHAVTDESAPREDIDKVKGNERILLVDDEADLADATALLLRKFGYDVMPMYYPKDALRIFLENPNAWDAVITDQVMPELKGLEMIAHMKKARPDIPIILCTGYSDFATERNSKAQGADAFFNKPVLPEDLALALRKLRDVKNQQHDVTG